jgi:ectoine hydroxylase
MWLTKTQVDRYNDDGFLLIPNYLSDYEVELLKGEIPKIFLEDSPRRILEKNGAVRSVFAPNTTNDLFDCVSRLERFVEPAKQLLRSEVYIHQFKINAKVALEGDLWQWHQDFMYWNKEDNMPSPRVLTVVIFLENVSEFNGPILLIPGSHKRGVINVPSDENLLAANSALDEGAVNVSSHMPSWMPTLTADLKYKISREILDKAVSTGGIYPAKGQSGFGMFFHGNIFHASANNLSPYDRTSVFITYNSIENTLGDVKSPRPTFIASRDFNPIVALPDDTLLKMGRGRHDLETILKL